MSAEGIRDMQSTEPLLGGDDTLRGGPGQDILVGGAGRDLFDGEFSDDVIVGNYARIVDNSLFDILLVASDPTGLEAISGSLFDLYSEEDIANCEADARRQAEVIAAEIVAQGGPAAMHEKQAMAVIAYLQRMGTDIFKTPAPAGGEKPADAVIGGVS